MSNVYEPTIDEMRVELQVLTRAVSTLFATHPDPTALRAAWEIAMRDLKPREIRADASDVDKKRYETHCAEYRLAMQLHHRISTLTASK